MRKLDPNWNPPSSTQKMSAIRQINAMESTVNGVKEKLKGKQEVTACELREVLKVYEKVPGDIKVSLTMTWDTMCKEANAHNLCKAIDGLGRALKRQTDDGRTNMGSN